MPEPPGTKTETLHVSAAFLDPTRCTGTCRVQARPVGRTQVAVTRRLKILLPLIGVLMLMAAPAGANAAASFHWNKAVRIEPSKDGGLSAVSCTNLQLCVAGDESGDILTSTKPAQSTWSTAAKVDSDGPITGVSCPTATFCGAVDQSGGFIWSTTPTLGAKHWSTPVRIDSTAAVGGGYAGLVAISCPSSTLCVAIDNTSDANVVYSTDPTGGKSAWKQVKLEGPATSVSCPTTTLCVIAGTERYVSVDPSVPTDWKAATALTDGTYQAVDCVGTTLCIGVGFGNTSPGFESATATPTGSWSTVFNVVSDPPAIATTLLDTVGCTRGTCVALDGADNAYTSTSAARGLWSTATAIRPDTVSQFNAVSCTSGMCVVVDSAGVETTGLLK